MRTPGFPIRFSRTPVAGLRRRAADRRAQPLDPRRARPRGRRRGRPDRPRSRGRRPAVTAFRGLTWDHPRGYRSLAAAAQQHFGAIDIAWETQSLEGFESGVDPRARAHLRPDRARPPAPRRGRRRRLPRADRRAARRRRRSSASRRRRSARRRRATSTTARSYALPLDAATQVQVLQPALVGDRPAPATWDEVLELAAEHPLALSRRRPARAAHVLLDLRRPCGRGAREHRRGARARRDRRRRARAPAAARRRRRRRAARREPHRDPRGDGDAACRRLLPARLRLRQLRARRTRAQRAAALRRRAAARLGARRHGHRDHAALRAHARARAPPRLAARRRARRRRFIARTRASRRRAAPGSTRRSTSAPAASTRPRAARPRRPGCARASRATSSSRRAPRSSSARGSPSARRPRDCSTGLGALWRAALPTGAAL